MIFHDRVTIVQRVETGEFDSLGRPIYQDIETPSRAEVRPLDSSENVNAAQSHVKTRFRVYMPASAESIATSVDAIEWRNRRFEIDGDIEPHAINGRAHHIEFIISKTTG